MNKELKMEFNLLNREDKVDLIQEMQFDQAELIYQINRAKLEMNFWLVGGLIIHFVLNILYAAVFQ